MRVIFFTFIAISTASGLMSACAPINSEFSCNATANDRCMSIEQVDAMTRFADGDSPRSNVKRSQLSRSDGVLDEVTNDPRAKVWLSQRTVN